MSALALGLLLVAAFGHATWNFLAKRAAGGTAFVWLFSALAALLYAPVAVGVYAIQRPALGWVAVAFMVGTAVLHTAYFVTLQRGYDVGELSVVYPLARSTGPVLAMAAAVALMGERPSVVASMGAGLVVAGALAISWRAGARSRSLRRSVTAGLLVGALIAGYTLWDKHAVSAVGVPPVLLDWAGNLGRAVLLSPYVLGRRDRVREQWRAHRAEALAIALLAPLSYILVLTAMAFTPVSYVAPAREVSVLVGTFLGSRLLGEGDLRRRLAAAALMLAGLAALTRG
ncbi:MAG: EamA family transporter [Firmicutes bacterium]|nr:EamA family transporter [Bacillota bacterium]